MNAKEKQWDVRKPARLACFLILGLGLAAPTRGQGVVREAFPERAPVTAEAAGKRAPEPLSLNWGWAFQEGRNAHTLAALSAEEVAKADQKAQAHFGHLSMPPPRVGMVRAVGPTPLAIAGGAAQRITAPGVGDVWTMKVQSPGAFGLRLHFSGFDVGDGSVVVYAADVDGVIVRGPYTGRGPQASGDFWTETLPGDTAFIEVTGAVDPRLEVTEVVHFDKDPVGEAEQAHKGAEPGRGSDSLAHHTPTAACHQDVMCHGSPPVDPVVRDATVLLNILTPSSVHKCTGTILNDLDNETVVPYLLTAYHCDLNTQAAVNNLEVVYGWQRGACGGALPNYATLPRTVGGRLLANNPTDGGNDMTFIRLNGPLPGGVGLAGWTTATPTRTLAGIHHPSGSFKRATIMTPVGVCGGCTFCADPFDYDFYNMISGTIEGGSSGSGIFNAAGQLHGQLFGICCLDTSGCAPCGTGDVRAYYGEFETTYPIIRRWLEIGGTIHLNRFYMGSELGTPSQPFRTVSAANNFAWDGARIKIQAASYPETLTFSKPLEVLAVGGTVTIGQ